MREQADLWARRWLAAVFIALMVAGIWPRGQTPEPVKGKPTPFTAKSFVGHLTVAQASNKTPTIPRGEQGDVYVEQSSVTPESTRGSGYGWRIRPLPMGPIVASDDAPRGWCVTRIPSYHRADGSFYGAVTVPESAVERDYLISITLYSTNER